jgi:Sigma-70 region 2
MTGARRVSSQTASSVNAPRPAESKTSTYDDGLAAFMSVRPRLFGIAYRMLGSAAEAEDVVQDVWVRWQTADRSLVREPRQCRGELHFSSASSVSCVPL